MSVYGQAETSEMVRSCRAERLFPAGKKPFVALVGGVMLQTSRGNEIRYESASAALAAACAADALPGTCPGSVIGGWEVVGYACEGSSLRVLVRCRCGTEKSLRSHDLLSGTQGCVRCMRRRASFAIRKKLDLIQVREEMLSQKRESGTPAWAADPRLLPLRPPVARRRGEDE